VEERTEDWVLLLENEGSRQSPAIHRRAVFDLHRLVKNLSIVKMENYGGTKHTGIPVKTLKKILKKAGLKVSGKKATLTRRAKRAKLFGGVNFRDKQLASRSTMGNLMKDRDIQTQYQKDMDDATKAREARETQIDQRLQDYRKSVMTLPDSKPAPSKFGEAVGNIFKGTVGGKKKRSRRS
jgi:hypothetical protein